jgi:23S rRNA (cytidine2498-2'-O)-methyltransferase
MSSRFIVTVTPELQRSALAELKGVAPDVAPIRDFGNGVLLVETSLPVGRFTEGLARADPVLIKHIMPVQAEATLAKSREADLPTILACARRVSSLAAGEHYAVQCRRIGADYDYGAKDVEVFVGSHFEAEGAVPQFCDTAVAAEASLKVISIYLYGEAGFVGFSTVRDNLNEHCDEYRVFSRRPASVSRAEYKLKEAMRKFGLILPRGRALDLGAAPGGWSKVLAEAGMDVVAVDPAELDERVSALPNVTHVRARAEECVGGAGGFELLVSDMNIEPEASARLMVEMAPRLRPGAYALMTVKLVIRNPARLLGNIVPMLDPVYDVVRVKNLFHNRLELTLLLRRKP